MSTQPEVEEPPIRLRVFASQTGDTLYEYWKGGKPISPAFSSLKEAAEWLKGLSDA